MHRSKLCIGRGGRSCFTQTFGEVGQRSSKHSFGTAPFLEGGISMKEKVFALMDAPDTSMRGLSPDSRVRSWRCCNYVKLAPAYDVLLRRGRRRSS